MKIYCVFDRYSVENGKPGMEYIDEIFFDEKECIDYVNNLNEKIGGGVDYVEADVDFHNSLSSDVVIVEHIGDDDRYATEAHCGETKILPPENYLIGTIEHTNRGIVVEFIDKSKI